MRTHHALCFVSIAFLSQACKSSTQTSALKDESTPQAPIDSPECQLEGEDEDAIPVFDASGNLVASGRDELSLADPLKEIRCTADQIRTQREQAKADDIKDSLSDALKRARAKAEDAQLAVLDLSTLQASPKKGIKGEVSLVADFEVQAFGGGKVTVETAAQLVGDYTIVIEHKFKDGKLPAKLDSIPAGAKVCFVVAVGGEVSAKGVVKAGAGLVGNKAYLGGGLKMAVSRSETDKNCVREEEMRNGMSFEDLAKLAGRYVDVTLSGLTPTIAKKMTDLNIVLESIEGAQSLGGGSGVDNFVVGVVAGPAASTVYGVLKSTLFAKK